MASPDHEDQHLIKVHNPFKGKKGYNCFGCSPDNPIGLKLSFRFDGEAVVSDWEPDDNFQGWMNVLHGGIQAALMDEIAGWLVMVMQCTAGVTSKMEVRLLRTAHMNRSPFHLKAVLQEIKDNIAIVKVELSDDHGQLCADALMHYYTWPDKIAREKFHYPGVEKFLFP